MGKHSNLILIDPNGIILDSAKRIPPAVSSLRTVLPGERYHEPPAQQKHDALALTRQQIEDILTTVSGGSAAKALVSRFYAFSPFTAQQLCLKSLANLRSSADKRAMPLSCRQASIRWRSPYITAGLRQAPK
jgi:predicted ribosome quality control (RQC) complex YloA/Tae2 family protein